MPRRFRRCASGLRSLGDLVAKQSCVFCGQRAGSREHLYPRWMSRALRRDGGAKRFSMRGTFGAWSSSEINLVTRRVCHDCNTGWMAQLEGDTRPILEPLLLDSSERIISVPDQAVLARWAYKTGLVLLAHEGIDPVPEWYSHFFTHREPTGAVFFGTYDGERREGRRSVTAGKYTPEGGITPDVENWFMARFNVFLPVFAVVGLTPGTVALDVGPMRSSFYRLWPPGSSDVVWPHPVPITDAVLQAAIPVVQPPQADGQ